MCFFSPKNKSDLINHLNSTCTSYHSDHYQALVQQVSHVKQYKQGSMAVGVITISIMKNAITINVSFPNNAHKKKANNQM